MKYFVHCSTKDEIKSLYRDLCKKHHPDVEGGDTATMQAINAEYHDAIKTILENAGRTTQEVQDEMEIEAQFLEKVQSIINVEGIIIELIGRWIWVSGNTYPVKDAIKSAGFKFASAKKVWFWHADEDRTHNRKEYSLEEIRSRHGSRTIAANYSRAISA